MSHISSFHPKNSHHAKLQGGGRLVIPAEYRKALDISVGEDIVMRLEGDEIRIYSLQQAVRRAQALVRKHVDKKRSLVDELIAERRQEAKREIEEATKYSKRRPARD